jgi:beta-amylase
MWLLVAFGASRCEFYVMVPVFGIPNVQKLEFWCQKLKSINVDGFYSGMDWSNVEPNERNYTWETHRKMVDIVKSHGLKIFPQVPVFPRHFMKDPDYFLKGPDGDVSDDYYSFAVDHVKILTRTPMEMLHDFCIAFRKEFQSYFDDGTFPEILTSGGPLGEFRYPGYEFSGKWSFPGCGQFQSFDRHLSKLLKEAAEAAGHPEWGHSPTNGGGQNVRPGGAEFWTNSPNGWNGEYGKWYIKWYHDVLVKHVFDYCKAMREGFGPDIRIVGKLAGLHWWYRNPTHCVETTCGMSDFNDYDGYKDILAAFKANNISGLSYTALEQGVNWRIGMDNVALMDQLLADLKPLDMWFEGENAGESYDTGDYQRVLNLIPKGLKRISFLAVSDRMFQEDNWKKFAKFVADVHNA